MKSIQFELWSECNNICEFCFLGTLNRKTPDVLKLSVLEQVLGKIREPDLFNEYDNISLIGGEFFQGQLKSPEVRAKFFELINQINDYLASGQITSSWITATLIGKNQDDLWDTLNILGDKNLWLTTSYDTRGRFHTPKAEQNWRKNILLVHEKSPKVKVNATIILTQDLIEKYLRDEFSFIELCNGLETSLFLKQPYLLNTEEQDRTKLSHYQIDYLFPKRKDFLRKSFLYGKLYILYK